MWMYTVLNSLDFKTVTCINFLFSFSFVIMTSKKIKNKKQTKWMYTILNSLDSKTVTCINFLFFLFLLL